MVAAVNSTEIEQQTKRKISTTTGISGSGRPVKRRASRACCCCRARKVRCDVVESGAPCTNCRLDQVACVVTESKRRRKSRGDSAGARISSESPAEASEETSTLTRNKGHSHGHQFLDETDLLDALSPSQYSTELELPQQQMPHLIYQPQIQRILGEGEQQRRGLSFTQHCALDPTTSTLRPLFELSTGAPPPVYSLPDYIRGLPQKLLVEDVEYLATKGALTIPDPELRNALLKSYVQYVHTCMPLLHLEEFLQAILLDDGTHRISLLLFQAVMFSGTAFVDIQHLRTAGYPSRKVARKAFFQKARLLYDFDYEVDRIALVQALLLMTYWYETPDDQKDTWHWMGVSLSLAHTIGLHRDPAGSGMDGRRKQLWKRIWWCAYTRDRLIALGMRRPMRIKDDDCDVSMLSMDDFEFKPFALDIVNMASCEILQNVSYQKQLAMMFIEKSKLCLQISHVLSTQYSVLSHKFGGTTTTTMMLVPKKLTSETLEVRRCDQGLEEWVTGLSADMQYQPPSVSSLTEAEEAMHVHRALLKMVYLATLSALHRPQVLPVTSLPAAEAELQDLSRRKVRHAAVELTNIAQDLHSINLTRFLPTTGVTVLLPAVIIHLLDVKSNDPGVRTASLRRFYQCMRILQRLKEMYASADFATSFLEAALSKAGIQVPFPNAATPPHQEIQAPTLTNPGPINRRPALTPPPDYLAQKTSHLTYSHLYDSSYAIHSPDDRSLIFAASTPPHSIGGENTGNQSINASLKQDAFSILAKSEMSLDEFIDLANDAEVTQNDFDALINFDNTNTDMFAAEEGLGLNLPSNSGLRSDNDNDDFELDWTGNYSDPILNLEITQNKISGLTNSHLNGEHDMILMSPKFTDHAVVNDLDTDL